MTFGKSPQKTTLEELKEISTMFKFDFTEIKSEYFAYQAELLLSDDSKKTILTSYKLLSKMYAKVLSIYADSYECESCFSKMNHILNEYRSNLTQIHLEHCLMVTCTKINLELDKIILKMDCQISH